MKSAIRFRGLTLYGTPMVFDKAPTEESGYLVFMTQAQYERARSLGLALSALSPWDEGDHAFYVLTRGPETP